MSQQVSAGMIIRYASHNLRFIYSNQHKVLQRVPQSFYRRVKTKNVCRPLCIDSQGHETHKLITKTYIKWINRIPHCHHEYSYARHISSALKCIKVLNPITTKSQREKLNSSQQDREGKTPYDPTILTKPAIHQDRDISRTRERER